MRQLRVLVHELLAGVLEELVPGRRYRFVYEAGYVGPPVSLRMPVREEPYEFGRFPPFFDALLPEGTLLASFLSQNDLDPDDYMGQLQVAGRNAVGAVSIQAVE